MLRRRHIDEGGDTSTFGVYGVLNPWRTHRGLPLTYQIEYDVGTLQRSSGDKTEQAAFYQEINYVAYNGVVLLLAYDWSDPDDEDHRLQLGLQVIPIAGVTVDGRFRLLIPAAGQAFGNDIFIQMHLYH